ncbi:MAG: 30S ribosome-binding factor RbfA [Phycisphaerales bacterium]|nr:30S ribosome-binding factor RbfA [Phycisphaerales bacterium]
MGHHRAQIESVLKRSVQDVLSRGLADPRIQGFVTVTRVEVSPDERQGTVWCSVMPAERAPLVRQGLKAASGRIHRELKDKLEMRRVPRLQFRIDESLKREADVLAAISEAKRQDEKLRRYREGQEVEPGDAEPTEDEES